MYCITIMGHPQTSPRGHEIQEWGVMHTYTYKFKSVFHKNVFAKTVHTDPIFDTIEICEVLGSKI